MQAIFLNLIYFTQVVTYNYSSTYLIYLKNFLSQGVPGGPAGLDHIRSSASSQSGVSGSNRSLGLPSGQGAAAPLESKIGSNGLPVDVLCKNCRKEANFMCSACKSVHYCSIDCQVNNKLKYFYEFINKFVCNRLTDLVSHFMKYRVSKISIPILQIFKKGQPF